MKGKLSSRGIEGTSLKEDGPELRTEDEGDLKMGVGGPKRKQSVCRRLDKAISERNQEERP